MTNIDRELLARALAAKAALKSANTMVEVATLEFATSLRLLNLSGASGRVIAKHVGLSHQRVAQLIEAPGDTTGWKRKGRQPKTLTCSFCAKTQAEALKVIAGTDGVICDSCVAEVGPVLRARAKSKRFAVRGDATCSFCGKSPQPKLKIATNGTSSICRECLDLCDEILAA